MKPDANNNENIDGTRSVKHNSQEVFDTDMLDV